MSTLPSQKQLIEMCARWVPPHQVPRRIRIHTDTTEFFGVEYDDVVVLDNRAYLIRHNAKELRFGLEDEPKYWVKYAIDLSDGTRKIIKLVFYEKFVANIADISFECFRSPRKEARILDLVQGRRNFMHGFSVQDTRGNIIRVLDVIKGKALSWHVQELTVDHETYFHSHFPQILGSFLECVQAIAFLHDNGEKHGDIRRDHILIDQESGVYRWIDFDYNYRHRENIYGYDLFGLGNILAFLAGKGDISLEDLRKAGHPSIDALRQEDFNIVFNNRIVHLKKIYPYIPDSLNQVLLHFAVGAKWFYENTAQLYEDLSAVAASFTGTNTESEANHVP